MSEIHPPIIRYSEPLDFSGLEKTVSLFAHRYPFLTVSGLGRSILGKSIPVFILGKGKHHLLYVGAHHGMEWLTSVLLLRFVNEFCELYATQKAVYHINLPFLWEHYSIHVIPMLNPDGVDYQIHGVSEANPLRSRVIGMNKGSCDFSHWQANARGVDLNHNYDAGFTAYKKLERENKIPCGASTRYSGQEPESEPEVSAICNYIRFHHPWRLVLSLHTQGEEIYYKSGGKMPTGAFQCALKVSQLCGYRLSEAEGPAAFGGLTDWCIQKLNTPALTLECGKGVNPLPLSEYASIYLRLREFLFSAPMIY